MKLGDIPVDVQRARFDLIIADSWVTRAEETVGDPEAAQPLLAKAEASYATILQLLPGLQRADERDEIRAGLNHFRVRLDAVGRKLEGQFVR